MTSTIIKRRWFLGMATLAILIGLLAVMASGGPSASAAPGTLLHVDGPSNQIHLDSAAIVKVTKINA